MIFGKCRDRRASLSHPLLGFVRKGASAFPASTIFHIHSLVLLSTLKGHSHFIRYELEVRLDNLLILPMSVLTLCAMFYQLLIIAVTY